MKKLLLLIMLFSMFACTAPQFDFRLESGRPWANPNYVLKDIGDSGLVVTFWFAEIATLIDKDGTPVPVSHTLTMDEVNILNKDSVRVVAIIEVFNPKEVEYRILFNHDTRVKNSFLTHNQSGVFAVSDFNYRYHTLDLPLSKDLILASFSGSINIGDDLLFTLGPLVYKKGG